jgi:demethoxyubiquinone hydroxylase (CLK1/Coq7/Cat5 family)
MRRSLTRILQAAHAGELAAANAYHGHWQTLSDPAQRAEVQRIELAELHHRQIVAGLLAELGARPQAWREIAMGAIGRIFGFLCRFSGWFFPMYMAGRLEAMNVRQYVSAAEYTAAAGLVAAVPQVEEMVREEERHEQWFSDRVRGHWLLPIAAAVFRWRPTCE